MQGRIHSLETMGLVDGPGIRYVVFLQGCLFRCRFCHNPDTWDRDGGRLVDSEELATEASAYLPYYQASGGGITVSGGEPLLQAGFVLDLFKRAKAIGLDTALDTTGSVWNPLVEELLCFTDLVLLDLKEMDAQKHRTLTGCHNSAVLRFARELEARGIETWARHVLVPGVTDSAEGLLDMGRFVAPMPNVTRVELLPFHKMGEFKWEALARGYTLSATQPPGEEALGEAYATIGRFVGADRMPGWKDGSRRVA
jgi:pyruvate formate lyase activating enzyme